VHYVDAMAGMHRIFQRDLCNLRVAAARAYVKTITEGLAPQSLSTANSLRLDVRVQGIGPTFRVILNLQNAGVKPVHLVSIVFAYPHHIYRIPDSLIKVPVLVPAIPYVLHVPVECIDPAGASDVIRVLVSGSKSCVPFISAAVNMPHSEVQY